MDRKAILADYPKEYADQLNSAIDNIESGVKRKQLLKLRQRPRGGRRSKFGNVRCFSNALGRKFDSKAELRRGESLALQAKATDPDGDYETGIGELEFQPKLKLTRANISYTPDFSYWDYEAQKYVWEDVKGRESDRFKVIKQLWPTYGPGILRITNGDGSLKEEIRGEGKE